MLIQCGMSTKMLKIVFFLSIMSFGLPLFAEEDPGIVAMWNSPMPDPSKGANRGYPAIPGAEHVLVFSGNEATGGYNHHACVTNFAGKIHLIWSNHRYAEDGPGQRVLYASSVDGKNWSVPREIVPALHPEAPWSHTGIHTGAGGWVEIDGRLFAKIWTGATVAWENNDKSKQSAVNGGECVFPVNRKFGNLYREVKPDGSFGPLLSQAPELFPDDVLLRPVAAASEKFAEPKVSYSWADALRQSKRRLCEPIMWQATDGRYVLLLRDDSYSHRKFVSFSTDGRNWTPPAPTDIPDTPSLSCIVRTGDGRYLLIGNHVAPEFDNPKPAHYDRDPLTVSVSTDGLRFGPAYAVRTGPYQYKVPRRQVRGRGGSAQYPSATIRDGVCFVAYSNGKEDIEVSSFPLSALNGEQKNDPNR